MSGFKRVGGPASPQAKKDLDSSGDLGYYRMNLTKEK